MCRCEDKCLQGRKNKNQEIFDLREGKQQKTDAYLVAINFRVISALNIYGNIQVIK